MKKYNIISDWLNATLSIQMRNTLQAFADGAARDQEQDVQPGDIVRWRLTSNGRLAFAVFRPEQAELPKARSKASAKPATSTKAKERDWKAIKENILEMSNDGLEPEEIADHLEIKVALVRRVVDVVNTHKKKATAKKKTA